MNDHHSATDKYASPHVDPDVMIEVSLDYILNRPSLPYFLNYLKDAYIC